MPLFKVPARETRRDKAIFLGNFLRKARSVSVFNIVERIDIIVF